MRKTFLAMYTKYTSLGTLSHLLCKLYNCIGFLTFSSTISKHFIDTLYLYTKSYENSNSKIVVKFCVHIAIYIAINTVFSYQVTNRHISSNYTL